jgi:hypothetical protein
MVQRMTREVPGLVSSYAITLLQEALSIIYGMQYWSWQVQTGGWLTPGLLFPTGGVGPGQSAGTITATPFTNTVVGDATASPQWLAYIQGSNLPLFTQLQIRSPYYSIYNIISYKLNTPSAGLITLTLDRQWVDPGGSDLAYMIYQAYFPVPVADFKRFLGPRDLTDNFPLDFWSLGQQDLALLDPERTNFSDPQYIVPYQQDQRPGSATYGNMLYELWPHQLSVIPYTFGYLRMGPTLVNSGDTVPYPLTEEALLWRAKECAYLYKEAQKGEQMERGMGADWKFLAQAAESGFKRVLKPIKDRDADLMPLYWSTFTRDIYASGAEPYATTNGQLNVGRL